MRKSYEEPELIVRNYLLTPGEVMTLSPADPSLGDGDDEDYFGN